MDNTWRTFGNNAHRNFRANASVSIAKIISADTETFVRTMECNFYFAFLAQANSKLYCMAW